MTRLRTRYTQRLPTAPGLRLDVPFFEGSGSKALDLSGKGNHGTLIDVTWSRSEKGVCGSFNGSSSHSDHGNDASLDITDAIMIEAWVKSNHTTGTNKEFNLINKGIYSAGYVLEISTYASLHRLTLYVNNESNLSYALNTNEWCHCVVTKTGLDLKMYINGVLVDSHTLGAGNGDISQPAASLYIAKVAHDSYFDGTINEVRIYNRALSAEAQKRRYEQPDRDYCRGG